MGGKQADFFLDQISLDTVILTSSRNLFNFENFMEISAVSRIADQPVSEIILQVVWSDENDGQALEDSHETA